MRRRRLRKIAQRTRREFEAGKAVLPRGNVINRPVITKLWVNGRASEDRDEWTEEVRAHCERCYDDKEETSEVQAERILSQRRRRDHCEALQGRRVTIMVDNVLRARGKMLRNKANGPAAAVSPDGDCVRGSTLVRQAFPRRVSCRVPQKNLTPSLRKAFVGSVRSHY